MPRVSKLRAKNREKALKARRVQQVQKKLENETLTCLACSTSCAPRSPSLRKWESQDKGKKTGPKFSCEKYLIQNVLRIPDSDFDEAFQELQPVYAVVSLCPTCSSLVNEIAEVSEEVARMTRRLDLMNMNLRKIIEMTRKFQDVEFGQEEQGVLNKLARYIRGRAYQNQSSSAFGIREQNDSEYDDFHGSDMVSPNSFDDGPQPQNYEILDSFDVDRDEKPIVYPEGYSSDDSDRNHSTKKTGESKDATLLTRGKRKAAKDHSSGSKVPKIYNDNDRNDEIMKEKKPKFSCGICSATFINLTDCNVHRENTHPGLAVCLELSGQTRCDKVFRAVDLQLHKYESHTKHQCPSCICEFPTSEHLNLHIQSRHPGVEIPDEQENGITENNWVQPLTTEEIQSLSINDIVNIPEDEIRVKVEETNIEEYKEEDSGLTDFYQEDVEIMKPTSKICNTAFETEVEMADHNICAHRSENKGLPIEGHRKCDPDLPVRKVILFKCGVCKRAYTERQSLMAHFFSDHNKNLKVTCFTCKMAFNSVEECTAHIAQIHPKDPGLTQRKTLIEAKCFPDNKPIYKCDKCTTVLPSQKELNEHLKTHLNTVLELKHQCRSCPVRCFTLESLKRHEDFHLIKRTRNRKAKNTTRLIKPSFPCSEPNCTEYFYLKWQLTMHKVKAHGIPKPKLECEFCKKVFQLSGPLQRHRLTHTGEYPLHCDQCDAKYRDPARLRHHIRAKHTNERPFKCKICPKTFTCPKYLEKHVAIHSDERPFLCSLCGKSFKTANNLYIHARSHKKGKAKDKTSKTIPEALVTDSPTVFSDNNINESGHFSGSNNIEQETNIDLNTLRN